MEKKQPSQKKNAIVFLSVAICLFCISSLFAAETALYPIYKLKNISAEQGKKILNEVGLGTVSTVPNTNELLITAQSKEELLKAKSILRMVDQKEQYIVHSLSLDADSIRQIGGLDDLNCTDTMCEIRNNKVLIITTLKNLDKTLQKIQNYAKGHKAAVKAEETVKAVELQSAERLNTVSMPQMFEASVNQDMLSQRITSDNTAGSPSQEGTDKISQQDTSPQAAPQLLASAQSLPMEPNIPNANDVLTLNLPEKLTLIQFLGLVGPYLRMDFAYDATKLTGEITFNPNGKLQGPVTVRDVYSYLEEVLKFKGFAMTRGSGNLVKIVPETDALSIDPSIVSPDNPHLRAGDIVILTHFELKHIDTSSAENLLKDMGLTIKMTSIPETQTLIITAYAYRIQRIRELLDLIDKPGKKIFKFRQLLNTTTQSIVPKLQNLADKLGTVSITISTSSSAEGTPPQQIPGESAAAYAQRVALWRAQQQAAGAAAKPSSAQPSATGPSVYLDSDDRTNRILMIGRQDQLEQLEDLIKTLDVQQQDLRKLEPYKVIHIDAADVRDKLIELGVIPDSRKNTTTTTQKSTSPAAAKSAVTVQPQTVPTTTTITTSTGEKVETLAGEPQVVLVEQTNTLLILATPEQHQRIAVIIKNIDNETERIPCEMYRLKNQDPNKVQEVLVKLVQETTQDPQSKIQTTVNKLEEPVTIVADSTTNSLIVYASPKNQSWIGDLIAKLDKRRPQVLIDVTLVQISKTDTFNYDLNILSSFPDLTSTSGLTSAIMSGATATSPISTLTNTRRDRFIDLQSKNGVGTVFYGDNHINALFSSMKQKNYGRVMAGPKVLVNDNETGLIETKDVTRVAIRSSAIISNTGTAGQTNTPVETSVDYRDYPAGITLEITPHISESDLLRLQIRLERSDFTTATSGDRPPDTAESTVSTNVTIPDGSTIILGGMSKLNQSKGDTRVPILGDLPLIGGLFRSSSNSNLQRNLYVFVKAEIIRPEDGNEKSEVTDLQRISDKNRTEYETQENKFQQYQGWPGIPSDKMEPFKVLGTESQL
jgi:general secretion pathway protein D